MNRALQTIDKRLDRAGTLLGLELVLFFGLSAGLSYFGKDSTHAILLFVPFQLAVAWQFFSAAKLMGSGAVFGALAAIPFPVLSWILLAYFYRRRARFAQGAGALSRA